MDHVILPSGLAVPISAAGSGKSKQKEEGKADIEKTGAKVGGEKASNEGTLVLPRYCVHAISDLPPSYFCTQNGFCPL